MAILAQGLKSNQIIIIILILLVAPPWAFNTGAMFGKGIYFADMFQKSWNYCEDY